MTYLILFAAIVLVLAWNFIPAFRKKIRGLSTVFEALLGAGLTFFGVLSDVVADLKGQGVLPDNVEMYVPYVIIGYIILKRIQTTTAVGK